MALVSNIITLGIGPSSDLMHLLTSGLGSAEVVVIPDAPHGNIGRVFSPVTIELARNLHQIRPVNEEVRL